MNRGSTAHSPQCRPLQLGFNEAPIHESGKCHGVSQGGQGVVASMRPRFMNRGSIDASDDPLPANVQLQ